MMQSTTLTRSAMWFYFGYWFREQKNLSNDTVECVSLVARWPAELPNQSSAIMAAAEETRLKSEAAVKELASEMYAQALYAAVRCK